MQHIKFEMSLARIAQDPKPSQHKPKGNTHTTYASTHINVEGRAASVKHIVKQQTITHVSTIVPPHRIQNWRKSICMYILTLARQLTTFGHMVHIVWIMNCILSDVVYSVYSLCAACVCAHHIRIYFGTKRTRVQSSTKLTAQNIRLACKFKGNSATRLWV